ncbi:TraR/DksA C4-type zinc finger protein [Paenibacillus sp. J2TS4]|uniref:TraR/DksA C4-type zinc finger protein n=1 Tax=Paenibacillus sp. J2TS4 TaxID=2807194 RepID=UPI001B263F1A|nr:TraR/DksA C4-type zinc finger protein [Paenibacillus sp. J2TS4]GIP36409.1 hypothetical protein J2TS4_56190 [Paenibacillus sp. J2TS4]
MQALTAEQKQHIKELLEQELRELEKQLSANSHYGMNSSLGDSTGELSTYDNHPADMGTEVFERGKDIALNDKAEKQLADVRDALERLNAGEYGHCVTCHAQIPYERLLAVPATLYCKEHTPETSINNRRPIEEEILNPPFGRTSLDELSEQNQFDGEDAWQIVESWGTSNTPAMAEDPEISSYDEMEVEADENDGYVEDYESFVATDLYGKHVSIIRNKAYRHYMQQGEGESLLEDEPESEMDQ